MLQLEAMSAEELETTLQSAVASLFQDGLQAKATAVNTLANIVDRCEGDAAEAVGRAIRDFGAIDPLLLLLDEEQTQQDTLRVIGNLASNAVDRCADETKRLLHDFNAFPRVLRLIHSPHNATVLYALGAVQNMLVKPEYAKLMQNEQADARLRQLLTAPTSDQTLCHFAKGCLQNMRAVLQPNFSAAAAAASEASTAAAATPQVLPSTSRAALIRASVPADNNCLFTSIATLCDRRAVSKDPSRMPEPRLLLDLAQELRTHMANMVISSPDGATTLAIIGCENADAYRLWIADETHWGGEPEVKMLADLYKVEILVAVCGEATGKVLTYGGGMNRPTVYLLYTGQHYDPLVGPAPSFVRTFPPISSDQLAAGNRETAAQQIAADHNVAAAQQAFERSRGAGSLPNTPGQPSPAVRR